MSAPTPAPRNLISNDSKKPIPTPRKTIPIKRDEEVNKQENNVTVMSNEEDNKQPSTFSRRVRTLSNTSKQIKDELAGKVNEKKKMMIEGTRQSMKRIARRFTTVGCENINVSISQDDKMQEERRSDPGIGDIFNSISFQSPIDLNKRNSDLYDVKSDLEESIYANSEMERWSNDSLESLESMPPPMYPPPPLREDAAIYDKPQSLPSSANSSTESAQTNLNMNKNVYESVFPSYPLNSDSESCVETNLKVSRSDSWFYYDSVVDKPEENIYSNQDASPTLQARKVECPQSYEHVISNKPDEDDSSCRVSVRNSLYENCEITPPPRLKRGLKPVTKSLILQFDPLKTAEEEERDDNSTHMKTLEDLFQVGANLDSWSVSNESDIGEYVNPPTPPVRFDSLPEETTSFALEKSTKTNWFLEETPPESNKKVAGSNNEWKRPSWFKQVNDVLKKAPDRIRGNSNNSSTTNNNNNNNNSTSNKAKDNCTLVRPSLFSKGVVQQKGMLYKITNGPVEDLFGEFSARWCILENGNFICYSDNTSDTIKEHFPMENIISVQALLDQKFKYRYENDDLHCFEVNVSGKSRGGYVYGSRSISERRIWMQKLAESMTNRFPPRTTSEYNRIGWAYIREGVSGEWVGAWVILCKRVLQYACDNSQVKSIDLRKARCIIMQPVENSENVPKTNDKGPNMLVDCPTVALYLRMWTSRETKAWCHIVRMCAHSNGALLEQQQLTKNEIPVIVEKCINFIYAHGSMIEGIYRKAGSGAVVQELLTQFRRDAWAVQLTLDKYSEHDVATALKRFFRDLPEPLLSSSNRQYLCQVSLVKNIDDRVRMYKAVFDQFNSVTYKTIRILLGHLNFINSQSKKNLMTIDNLAAVWGPTLMQYDDKEEERYSQKDAIVVGQLISLYKNIFAENAEEIEQERKMLQVLEKCVNSPQGPVNTKASGDLRVWIHLENKDGETFNIAIGPQKTAYDVCLELCFKAKLPVHELVLEEVVLNENLSRPIHHKEKVLDVVLRWSYWNESDRKDNILILSPLSKYWEFLQDKILPVSGELKFADNKTKIFKPFTFEFAQAKLTCFKDKSCSVKLFSWNVEDIVWYLGNESKRNPPTKWTITFFQKNEHPIRTKSAPWFGNILVWADPAFRAIWLASMLISEHPKDLKPSPQHVNLMSD